MLREVLQAVESAEGPVTLNELSRRLNLDPRVLDGMLDHWSRRGKLVVDGSAVKACADCLMPSGCSCGAASTGAGCPFMVRLPKSYTVSPSIDILNPSTHI